MGQMRAGLPTVLAAMLQLCGKQFLMRARFLISLAIGSGACLYCWILLTRLHLGAGDFSWAISAAQDLLAGVNPYANPLQLYPLTAAFFGLPFVRFPPELAASLFFGLSSGLLSFGLTRDGYHRLVVFFAYPYWAALLTAQWTPLIMASAFFPLLLPATMAKPQIGLPVFLTHVSKRGVLACLALGLLTLMVMPKWPLLWMEQLGHYDHFFPVLVVPGPLLLLALLRYRDRGAMLLLNHNRGN